MNFSNICIDFGTCNTVISYFDNTDNKLKQITDDYDGNILISTIIYFNEETIKSKKISNIDQLVYLEDYFIGNNINITNPKYYFYQFKRFLGITDKLSVLDRNFIDKFNKEYTLDEDSIYFYIETYDNNKIKFSIVHLIKLYFKGLYSLICKKLNIKPDDNDLNNKLEIVLTCPAYFHDLQRQQLKNAASEACFKIFKLYNEPTTAAIYYIKNYFNEDSKKENNSNKFIVYDLGGGTIDTTVVEYHEELNTCEIIDIDGNNSLGGIDIDNIIIYDIYSKYFIDKSNLKFKNNIKNIAEDIKIKLSYNTNYDIYLENIPIIKNNILEYKDILKISYTRHYINSLINDIIEQMIQPIKNMYTKHNTSNIIFIGGPTQIPLLQNKVNLILNKNIKTINNKNNNILYKTIVSEGGTLLYNLINKK